MVHWFVLLLTFWKKLLFIMSVHWPILIFWKRFLFWMGPLSSIFSPSFSHWCNFWSRFIISYYLFPLYIWQFTQASKKCNLVLGFKTIKFTLNNKTKEINNRTDTWKYSGYQYIQKHCNSISALHAGGKHSEYIYLKSTSKSLCCFPYYLK